jgi:hypothetical protein
VEFQTLSNMNLKNLISELIDEVAYRSNEGLANLQNIEHIRILAEVLDEWGYSHIKNELISNLLEVDDEKRFSNPILRKSVKYTDENGEDKEGMVGDLLRLKKDTNGRKAAEKLLPDEGSPERKEINKELGSEKDGATKTTSSATSATSVEKSPEEKQQTANMFSPDSYNAPDLNTSSKQDLPLGSPEQIKSELDTIQTELQQRRDSGDAGAGTPVASQGESRFCNTLNTLNYDSFVSENQKDIDTRKQEYRDRNEKGGKNKYPNASEWEIIRALGYGDDPTSEEVLEYLAAREAHSKKELERIKEDPNSVFYRKNGFNGNDEAYLEWMRAGFDGAIATKKILEEDTILDTDKPFTTIQSNRDIDDKVESILENKLAKAKEDGNQEDIEFYTAEINSFKKFRKYHDTYVVGQDKNGRTTVVSVSNKKGSDLKDPQNNTTPANRFRVIKDTYGDDVAKLVTQTLDDAIDRVSDTKISAVKRTNRIDIDDSIVAICDTPEMSKYMKSLSSKAAFRKYAEDKGKSVDNMTTREKLELMKEHSQLLLDSGKTPAFEPYGKIATKIGEFTQIAKYKKQYPEIDFDTDSVGKCISIKQDEKDAVTAAHQSVVNDIANADAKQGFPKDGINGPHTQGYLSTIMDAMHFDTYIDGGDGKMIIQMGIRGAQPQDIRSCLAEQSGYKGDANTTEGREGLKKHLREKCRVDAKSGAVTVSDGTGERSICEDTWRTAGTSQKVASAFGEDMRRCIKKSVDSRRKSK